MGSQKNALDDVRRCIDLKTEEPLYRFRLFILQTKEGDYDAARQSYEGIVGDSARLQFDNRRDRTRGGICGEPDQAEQQAQSDLPHIDLL